MRNAAIGFLILAAVGAVGCGGGQDGAGGMELGKVQAALTLEQCEFFMDLYGSDKLTICHHAASNTENNGVKKFVAIAVNWKGCEGHEGHPLDYVAFNDPSCNGEGCFPEGAPYDGTAQCCAPLLVIDDKCTCVPQPEVCDGLDNDCDGLVDGGDADGDSIWDLCDNCPTVANPGQEDCNGNGVGNVCDDAPEVCNGQDDDCDGQVDEGGDSLCPDDGDPSTTAQCKGVDGCEQVTMRNLILRSHTDNTATFYLDGVYWGSSNNWVSTKTLSRWVVPGDHYIAVENAFGGCGGGAAGFVAIASVFDGVTTTTIPGSFTGVAGSSWKAIDVDPSLTDADWTTTEHPDWADPMLANNYCNGLWWRWGGAPAMDLVMEGAAWVWGRHCQDTCSYSWLVLKVTLP